MFIEVLHELLKKLIIIYMVNGNFLKMWSIEISKWHNQWKFIESLMNKTL
jgi:hypothetical protein